MSRQIGMNAWSSSEKERERWLSNFSRLFDLYQRSKKDNPKNYFNFEEFFHIAFLGAPAYAQIESFLQRLGPKAWEKLRCKALPYLTVDHPTRGYEQLFSALDEARGYALLADQGYERIEFIEADKSKRGGKQLPDLIGFKRGSAAILEVKTINESDNNLAADAAWRKEAVVVPPHLSEEFKRKAVATIEQVKSQLLSYPRQVDRKIVLLVVRFDYGQKTAGHLYAELDDFISTLTPEAGIEVFHQPTPG